MPGLTGEATTLTPVRPAQWRLRSAEHVTATGVQRMAAKAPKNYALLYLPCRSFRIMKKLLALLLVVSCYYGKAQSINSTCANAIQICFADTVTFPASINAGTAEAGPDYDCLGSQPNPAWFYFQTQTPGTHTFLIANSNDQDLDFIIYGPFTSMTNVCGNLTADVIATCSYAGGPTETANFTSEADGYYVLLITNFSNNQTTVILNQTAGTGNFACDFVLECLMSLGTPDPGPCDTITNHYPLSGQVFSFNPPSTGTLTITAGSFSQVIQAPFNNAQSYVITGMPSDGATLDISAVFSANPSCSAVGEFTSPSGCIPCQASVLYNGPVCENGNLSITCSFEEQATYQWTGPNGYTGNNDIVQILGVTAANAGTYTVFISNENCSGTRSIDVEIVPKPVATIFDPGDICEGEILFLGAAELAGGIYHWFGPLGFTAETRNTQLNDAQPAASGTYNMYVSVAGCTSITASVNITVRAAPVITISGDTTGTPGGTSVFVASGSDGNEYFWNFYGSNTIVENTVFTAASDTVVVFWNDEQASVRVEVLARDSSGCFGEPVSMNIDVTGWVGINDNSFDGTIVLSPNPATDAVRIRNSGATLKNLRLTDVCGKTVWTGVAAANSNLEIPLDGFASGIYLLANSSGSDCQRLVISR